jgi:hypothetical protein
MFSGLLKKAQDHSPTVVVPQNDRGFRVTYGTARVSKRCSICLFPQPVSW